MGSHVEKRLSGGAKQMTTEADINKLAHDSLLRELHNIDSIAETFARTAILIVVALLAFISTLRTQDAIWVSLVSAW